MKLFVIWKDDIDDIQSMIVKLTEEDIKSIFGTSKHSRTLEEQAIVDAIIVHTMQGDIQKKVEFKKARTLAEKLNWFNVELSTAINTDRWDKEHARATKALYDMDPELGKIWDFGSEKKDSFNTGLEKFVYNSLATERQQSIPTESIRIAEQKFISELLEGSRPTKHDSLLRVDEILILDIPDISYQEERVSHTEGTFAGISLRATKRISVRGGAFQGKGVKKVKEIDNGTLLITNSRIIFDGKANFKEIPIGKIQKWDISNNALILAVQGKQKKEYYNGISNFAPIDLELIPHKDDTWTKSTVKWELTPSNLFSIMKQIT